MKSAFDKLQSFNVCLCKDSGAGKGSETTQEALNEYARLMAERSEEVRPLIEAARIEQRNSLATRNYLENKGRTAYINGIEAALQRALAKGIDG